jgi:hypothetical protein
MKTEDLKKLLSRSKELTSWARVEHCVVPLLGSASGYWVGPPSANWLVLCAAIAAMTWVTSICCFIFCGAKTYPKYRLKAHMIIALVVFVSCLALYWVLAKNWVITFDSRNRFTIGDYNEVSLLTLEQFPNKTDRDLLFEAGTEDGSTTMVEVYTRGSVIRNELTLTMLWVFMYVGFAGFTACLALLLRKDDIASKGKTGNAKENKTEASIQEAGHAAKLGC